MDEIETSYLQRNWSQSDGEEADEIFEKPEDVDASLPFCFVAVWPNDVKTRDIFKEALKMFKRKDQQLLELSEKIRKKVAERQLVIGRMEDLKYKLRKLNMKIGEMINAKRDPKEDVDNLAVFDESMEKKKEEKKTLEAKIKEVEKEFEDIKEEIWSHMGHLKEKHCRHVASVCMLDQKKFRRKCRWYFTVCYLESIHTSVTGMTTTSNTL